jgi:hypothetical protein
MPGKLRSTDQLPNDKSKNDKHDQGAAENYPAEQAIRQDAIRGSNQQTLASFNSIF